ncbi:MAG: membrane-bound O-acyltransferase family protein [Bacteroidetes bacterium HGW-Bacteroidetes-19]|nr:MAG: membrane-bound O-acyltransferase family protein [Bacteroidetes bacterium HGW-Bacteroidetes-19]
MVFNSTTFLIFFILFFFIYWGINNRLSIAARNLFIIISSYIFYGWWDWRFLSLIAFSTIVDFSIGYLLSKNKRDIFRKGLLIISIIVNLGLLAFFKYFNFFIESLNVLLISFSMQVNITTLKIILPVGISFYTFQTLSYTIDVYKKKLEPTTDILSFFAFVSFFPQLVAGPIERASHLLKQFQVRKLFNYDLSIAGLRLVLWGLFKKIVIADNFGILADSIFNQDSSIPGVSVMAGALFFALQIYADFSGYSDIAIGISRMLGFDLMVNFKTPYFATSFGDFWSRWHISLSTWFRDYVYIPLGGNQKGNFKTQINLLTTFLLSGLWHGANVTFLIWGGLHGSALILEKRFKRNISKYIYAPVVIFIVILLWIPFRAESFTHLMDLFSSIIHIKQYSFSHLFQIITDFSEIRFCILGIVCILFLLFEYNMNRSDFNTWISQKSKTIRIVTYYILIFMIILIGNFSVKPSFIYFQF